jgi:hypothetical protein
VKRPQGLLSYPRNEQMRSAVCIASPHVRPATSRDRTRSFSGTMSTDGAVDSTPSIEAGCGDVIGSVSILVGGDGVR